jgi:hypothetical protein
MKIIFLNTDIYKPYYDIIHAFCKICLSKTSKWGILNLERKLRHPQGGGKQIMRPFLEEE